MENKSVSEKSLYRILSQQIPDTGDYGSLYIKASSFPCLTDEIVQEITCNNCVQRIGTLINDKILSREAAKYKTGIAIFWQEFGPIHIVLPPFPINRNNAISGAFELSIFHEILSRPYVIAIILVTWGSYAVGLFHGDRIIASKVGTGHIHKEHKKGGSSQKRFARRTEEQRKEFIRRVSSNIEEYISGYTPDYIYFGGNRLIYTPLYKHSRYLQLHTTKLSNRILNIKHANQQVLEQGIIQVKKPLLLTYPNTIH